MNERDHQSESGSQPSKGPLCIKCIVLSFIYLMLPAEEVLLRHKVQVLCLCQVWNFTIIKNKKQMVEMRLGECVHPLNIYVQASMLQVC